MVKTINKRETKLTEHFTLAELTHTNVKLSAVESERQHSPRGDVRQNLKRVCRWLEMRREEWNRRYGEGSDPIIINSGYRSESVNKAVGRAYTSNHLSGCAADIRVDGKEQLLRYATILLDISDESDEPFDELILEYKDGRQWLHFAVREAGNRRRIVL